MAGPLPELRAVFCEALDHKTPQAQAAYLDQVCQGRPELRARVEALLQAHAQASEFLQEPSGPAAKSPGTVIGPDKLLEARYRIRKFALRHKVALSGATLVALTVLVAVGGLAGSIGWAARDRAARRVAIREAVDQALTEAEHWQQQGQHAEALSAVRRAEGLLAGDAGCEEVHARVRRMLADQEMTVRLEDIRLDIDAAGGQSSWQRMDQAYAQAFGDYGIDVDCLAAPRAADRIRARPIARELVLALDDWTMARRRLPNAAAPAWKHLAAVARAADPDPWRNRLRDAVDRGDGKVLEELARSNEAAALPPSTLHLLGRTLRWSGALGPAADLMRRAQQRYPGDFWINHLLGLYLAEMDPEPVDEVIRFRTAAVAVRSQSPVAHYHLALALGRKGRHGEALTACRRAVELRPDYADALAFLGATLVQLGQWEEAVAELSRILERHGDLVEPRHDRGLAYAALCQWDRAVTDLAPTVQGQPPWGPWAEVACLHLLAGDVGAYRDLCRRLPCLVEQGKDPFPVYEASRAGALSPGGPLDPTQVVTWAERAVAAERSAWRLQMLGLARYRAGQFDEAVKSCNESLGLGPQWRGRMLNWTVLALAHHRLNHPAEARRWLARAMEWRERLRKLDEKTVAAPPALLPLDWLEFNVLYREAQALMNGNTR
jgi:tetratricopeptide (TPR) repeat protein